MEFIMHYPKEYYSTLITPRLEEYAKTRPISFMDLVETKYTYHLTDFGLEELVDTSLRLNMSPWELASVIEHVKFATLNGFSVGEIMDAAKRIGISL